nr:WecB/TagA/CpsF family glycosyltransferase [Pseudarthrobacter psychrotolerans]
MDVPVANAQMPELVSWFSDKRGLTQPLIAYALHVGGMVRLHENPSYRSILMSSSVVYADGVGPVMVGRAMGGKLGRAATTDLGPEVLAQWSANGAPPRIALIGGPDGLARDAGLELERLGLGKLVFSENGYHEDWASVLSSVRDSHPDILFVGMGAPREMEWCVEFRSLLPKCVVMTCGGWFGFLVGNEKRAPQWAQKAGGEWIWRLAQSPMRLGGRYGKGAFVVARALLAATRSR